jgi:hypothetical protein
LKSPGTWTAFHDESSKSGSAGAVLHADVVFDIPWHDVVAVLTAALLPQSLEKRNAIVEVFQRAQGVNAGEGLSRNAAHRDLQQADWHVRGLEHFSAEEIRRRRKTSPATSEALWCNDSPQSSKRNVCGRVAIPLSDVVETHLWIICVLEFLGPVSRLTQAKLHVRLTGADPHVANQHVLQFDYPRAGDLNRVGAANRGRIDLRHPLAVGSGGGRRGVVADLHTHGLSGLRPSPDRIRLASLQHHVVAEDRADEWRRSVLLRRTLWRLGDGRAPAQERQRRN